MSSSYLVMGEIVDPFLWADGDYVADVTFVGEKNGTYGNYMSAEWTDNKTGKTLFETFNVNSSEENIRKWQLSEWFKFCLQVGGIQKGEEYKESRIYGKRCKITVKNIDLKNGKRKSIVTNRVPVDESTGDYPVSIPALNVSTSAALNDEVPF